MSYIKQLIEKYSLPAKRTVAVGLVAFCTLSSLTACGDIANDIIDTNGTKITETSGDINFTESGNNQTGNQSGNQTETNQSNNQNETNQSTNSNINDFDRFEHSDAYNQAKQEWGSAFRQGFGVNTEQGFLSKPAPFSFLAKEGLVYYNTDGEPRAYGTDEDFDNYQCIQSNAWIDPSTPENDFYLLTQYISAPIDDSNSNDETYVATYMLKYTLDDPTYRDMLEHAGDGSLGKVIYKMDENITKGKGTNNRELISKSVIRYDLIKSLGLFKDLPNGGVDRPILGEIASSWVSNIDYTNMAITVNYNTKANRGDIYSYTYKLKETPNWDKMLKGNVVLSAVSQEYRDSLTPDKIMTTYSSPAGPILDLAEVEGWKLIPSTSQKATANIKHEFVPVEVNATATNDRVNDYEAGKISYAEVNSLTRDYVNSLKSGLTK